MVRQRCFGEITLTERYFWMLFLGVLAALCGLLIFRVRYKRAKLEAQQLETQRQRDIARCQAIEEDLQEWLMTLGLPALAEQKQLIAVARQLRIVLVERLMNGPKIR